MESKLLPWNKNQPIDFGDQYDARNFEIVSPISDSISALKFSPPGLQSNLLMAAGWDNLLCLWNVVEPIRALASFKKTFDFPLLDICWKHDGSVAFAASSDKRCYAIDIETEKLCCVAQHDQPIKTCHWVNGPKYSCLITGSWDKTLKFWDTRTEIPIATLNLPERCYCAAMTFPYAVVGTADKSVTVYDLNLGQEIECYKNVFKNEIRAIAMSCELVINKPNGFAVGSINGLIKVHIFEPIKRDIVIKCHRKVNSSGFVEISACNDITFHPIHNTLTSVGSDGTFVTVDVKVGNRIGASRRMEQSITKCAISADGQYFVFAVGYDWTKGHAYHKPNMLPKIFIRNCLEEMEPFHDGTIYRCE